MKETTEQKQKRTIQALCDIYRDNNKVILRMEMPGVSKDSLNVRVEGDRLLIHGQKQTIESDGEYRLQEIRDCDYYHEFSIDDTVDREKIDASIKNGIVMISLGIKESEKPKKIKVTIK